MYMFHSTCICTCFYSTTTTTTTPTEVTGSSETQPTGEQEGSSIMQASSELGKIVDGWMSGWLDGSMDG